MSGQKEWIRYSEAFKQKVINEIEEGKHSIGEARKIYDIKGYGTIYEWIKKYGKNHLIGKVVRIEMKGEKDRLKELEKENKRLKEAMSDMYMENHALTNLIKLVEKEYGIELKKNSNIKTLEK
ncbi:MAG: transposase [Calditrichia bacterium]|nr:transposase [Calditrichia bacterium]